MLLISFFGWLNALLNCRSFHLPDEIHKTTKQQKLFPIFVLSVLLLNKDINKIIQFQCHGDKRNEIESLKQQLFSRKIKFMVGLSLCMFVRLCVGKGISSVVNISYAKWIPPVCPDYTVNPENLLFSTCFVYMKTIDQRTTKITKTFSLFEILAHCRFCMCMCVFVSNC